VIDMGSHPGGLQPLRGPRPGETGHDTWQGDDWKNRSGTNVWGLFTLDAEHGVLYMPFGEPTTDYWGGDRPGKNLFGYSVLYLFLLFAALLVEQAFTIGGIALPLPWTS